MRTVTSILERIAVVIFFIGRGTSLKEEKSVYSEPEMKPVALKFMRNSSI